MCKKKFKFMLKKYNNYNLNTIAIYRVELDYMPLKKLCFSAKTKSVLLKKAKENKIKIFKNNFKATIIKLMKSLKVLYI